MGPVDDPEYQSEKRKALQDMRKAEESAAAAEKEDMALWKLQATKEKDWQLSTRNAQVKVAENRERISGAAAAQREAQAIRQLADETARYRDQIEDAADEVGILTKKQIEMAKLAGVKMDKPGGNLEKMEAAVDKQNKLLKKVVDPGFHAKTGEWVKTSVQQYADTGIKNLDRLDKALTKTKRIFEEGRGSRVKPRYASDDPTLPGYEHPEQVYGRSLADMGKTSGVKKDKYGEPLGAGSKIPQGRSMDDRMKLFVDDIGTRFQVASQIAKEMFVSGDKAMEVRLRAISDQYFGTDTQKPWEKAWNEDYFNPLTTIPESGFEHLGINPSLLARVGGQTGRGKRQDYSRAHPIHAIHMLKKLLGDVGEPAGALMPTEAIDQAYQEIVGDVPYKAATNKGFKYGNPAVVKPDKAYLKTVDPVVNAVVKGHISGLKAEIDQMIGKFQAVHTTLTGEARGSALSEIWTKIKAVQRAEGSDWTKARRDLMLELNPPKPDPYKDPELGNRMSEMFGRPNIPAGASIDPEPWTGGAANQAAIAKVFGPVANQIKKTILYHGDAEADINRAKEKWFTSNVDEARYYAGIKAGVTQSQPIIEKLEVAADELAKFKPSQLPDDKRDHYVLPTDVASGAVRDDSLLRGKINPTPPGSPMGLNESWTQAAIADSLDAFKKFDKISKPNNVTGLLAAGHVQDTVEKMGQVREAIQNQFQYVEDAYDQVASVPQDMLNKALGGRPAIEYNKQAAEVMAAAARETSQVAQRQAENMAYLQEIKPLAAQARASLVEEAAATKDIMGRISPSVKGTYDQATWMKKMDQHKAILMAESQIGFQESSADEGRSQNQIAAEWARHWAKILPPTHKLGEIIDKATSGGLVAVPQKVIEDYITRLRVKYDKEQTRMGIPGYEHPVEGSTPTAEEMVGKDWFIKVKARTQADLAKAMGLAEGAPGFKTSTSGNLLGSGNIPGTGVERTATISGRASTVEEAQQTLGIFKQIEGLGTIDHEKTSLLLSQKKLSFSERMYENANKMRGLNRYLVQSQMAMLGIYFSMLSVTNLLGQAWGKIGQSVGNLEGMFKSIGEALAFGRKGTKSYELVQNMLKDTKNLVGAWKNYTGVMGLFSSMMTVIAYKLFTDQRLVNKIYDIMDKLAEIITDPAFADNLIKLFMSLLDALPDIVKGVGSLVSILGQVASIPGIDKLIGFMVSAGLAAAVLMPILALLGAGVEALRGIFWALGMGLKEGWLKGILVKAFAGASEYFAAAVAELAGVGVLSTSALVLSVGAGLLLGLGLVRVMIETGITKMFSDLGKWLETSSLGNLLMSILKIVMMPFGLLGTLIVDIVTLQFANIPKDLAHVVGTTVSALLGILQNALRAIPVIGNAAADALNGAVSFNNYVLKNTVTSTQARASGGSIFAGQTYLVGERGPELFTSGRSGTITPNNQLGGGGDIYITNNIGTVNSVANLRDVLDAANMSAKYSYSGG